MQQLDKMQPQSARSLRFACALLASLPLVATGEYRCVDEQGNASYVTQPRAGCEAVELDIAPPTETPAFLAHLPKHELKLDTMTGCGLIDSASIGPGATLAELRIGRDSLEEAIAKLERQGAKFKADLGYRGYREDLPIAAVQTIPALQQAGPFTQAWLRFNSLRVLYRLTLVWEGETALTGVQALLAKQMPQLAAACSIQAGRCGVEQTGVSLELHAADGRVTLNIASIPLDKEARNTEKLIDADILRKRVGSARNE
jgi:hypothetical protein